MSANWFLKLIISTGLIFLITTEIRGNDGTWIDDVVKSIKSNSRIYEVIFVIDDVTDTSDSIYQDVIQRVSREIPVREIIIADDIENDVGFYHPLHSFFIFINSELLLGLNLFTYLSQSYNPPKCLIIVTYEFEYKLEFFEYLWSRKFLDVTVAEVKKSSVKGIATFLKIQEKEVRTVRYNPFTKSLFNEIANSSTVWFPNKIKNLHGYPLVIEGLEYSQPGVFDSMPELRNFSISGLAIEKSQVLLDVMNFTLVDDVDENEMEYVHFSAIENSLHNYAPGKAKGFRKLLGCVLAMPSVKTGIKSEQMQLQVAGIFVVISLMCLVWIATRILRFSGKNWRMEYLIRIACGTTVPEEPTSTKERIIFAALLIGCFIFSSEMYTRMAKLEFPSSNMIVKIYSSLFKELKRRKDIVSVERYGKVEESLVLSEQTYVETCLEELVKYKNVSCLVYIPDAKLVLERMMNQNVINKGDRNIVKFVTDVFPSPFGYTKIWPHFPVIRIDELFQRLIDSGIVNKWIQEHSTDTFTTEVTSEQIYDSCIPEQSNINIRQLIDILFVGFTCSFLVFICELLYEPALKILENRVNNTTLRK